LICRGDSKANQRSTWFNHELCVGVKCRW